MPVATWKVIKPNAIKSKAMIAELKKAVEQTITEANKEFGKTYATWQHKPAFVQKYKETTNALTGDTTTTEKGSKDNPYPFVARGTRVRRALMTSDFSPKTKPNVIGSTGGRGGVLFISKQIERPGIKARNFEKEIVKLIQPKFSKYSKAAMKKARQVSGQAI